MAKVRTSVKPLNYLNETIPLDLVPMLKWFWEVIIAIAEIFKC